MSEWWESTGEVLCGDCLEVMGGMEDATADAVVTDPPYGLSFMGKGWDHSVPGPEYWREALRVAKPGAHLLCFGGTRTFHRMACAIEDAGWEIRDCVMWVYGSGFPKSMNVSKAIDRALGVKQKVVGHREAGPNQGFSQKKGMGTGPASLGGSVNTSYDLTAATSEPAQQWDGWGTCLKPAWEPIIVARKPLDGTVAHNVMTHGVGALNIDACRIGTDTITTHNTPGVDKFAHKYGGNLVPKGGDTQHTGRFPANLVHDGSEEVLELFPESKCGKAGTIRHTKDGARAVYGDFSPDEQITTIAHGGDGSAARFFYCAKASKRDRGEGNDHPTVKPTALMEWLVKLVTPEGGLVLDPFMGSGSTLVAAKRLGLDAVGIDMEPKYCEIAKRRLEAEDEPDA